MKRVARLEIVFILLLSGVSFLWLKSDVQSEYMLSAGHIVLYISACFLAQGLLRDVLLLSLHYMNKPKLNKDAQEKNSKSHGALKEKEQRQEKMQCICLESSVGLLGVVTGSVISLVMPHWAVVFSWFSLSCIFTLTLSAGYIIKDYIFVFSPLSVRREEGHINIIPTWRG